MIPSHNSSSTSCKRISKVSRMWCLRQGCGSGGRCIKGEILGPEPRRERHNAVQAPSSFGQNTSLRNRLRPERASIRKTVLPRLMSHATKELRKQKKTSTQRVRRQNRRQQSKCHNQGHPTETESETDTRITSGWVNSSQPRCRLEIPKT